jgi:ribosome-binding protein aMBF1 (putative translation factor)
MDQGRTHSQSELRKKAKRARASEAQILQGFGRCLVRLRRTRRWTQEELAHRTGLHRSYIAGVEAGYRNISFKNLLRLAHGLEIDLEQLFQGFALHEGLN